MVAAHLIREYLEHFKMDYTQSVYMPEVALQHTRNFKDLQHKEELQNRLGIEASESGESVLV